MKKPSKPKVDIGNLPEKYPKRIKEGGKMDYSDATVAYPKPVKKAKKKGWGK